MASVARTFPARIDVLDAVNGFVDVNAARSGLDDKKKFGLLVALEEAFVNVCHYAYPGAEGDVEVTCGREGDSFAVEIADRGVAFDVLSLPDPDTTTGLMERDIGGLGVYFIRKLTDEVHYRRENGRNILRMVLHLPPGEGPP